MSSEASASFSNTSVSSPSARSTATSRRSRRRRSNGFVGFDASSDAKPRSRSEPRTLGSSGGTIRGRPGHTPPRAHPSRHDRSRPFPAAGRPGSLRRNRTARAPRSRSPRNALAAVGLVMSSSPSQFARPADTTPSLTLPLPACPASMNRFDGRPPRRTAAAHARVPLRPGCVSMAALRGDRARRGTPP